MAKNDKQIKRLQDRIKELEDEMQLALQKKRHGSTYDIVGTQKKINDLKQDLKRLQ